MRLAGAQETERSKGCSTRSGPTVSQRPCGRSTGGPTWKPLKHPANSIWFPLLFKATQRARAPNRSRRSGSFSSSAHRADTATPSESKLAAPSSVSNGAATATVSRRASAPLGLLGLGDPPPPPVRTLARRRRPCIPIVAFLNRPIDRSMA